MLKICARLAETDLLTTFKNSIGLFSQVRFRYYEDNKDKQIVPRRYGYKDHLAWRGLLPRSAEQQTGMPVKEYLPSNLWCERKALFGQNDYIDILGDEKIHPVNITYNVPGWLKGFRGSEYQMLIRKRNFFGHKILSSQPDLYKKLKQRMKFIYHRQNHGYFVTRMHKKKDKMFYE